MQTSKATNRFQIAQNDSRFTFIFACMAMTVVQYTVVLLPIWKHSFGSLNFISNVR